MPTVNRHVLDAKERLTHKPHSNNYNICFDRQCIHEQTKFGTIFVYSLVKSQISHFFASIFMHFGGKH